MNSMSATVAMTPSPVPHDRSSYMDIAHPSPSGQSKTASTAVTTAPPPTTNHGSRGGSKISKSMPKPPTHKYSPKSSRNEESSPIVVKKEPPSSPEMRHRPQKLDLKVTNGSSNNPSDGTSPFPSTSTRPAAGPLTARIDGLGIQEVGLACLSPGFNTQDPAMRDHLQKSISVRVQQRSLIEARMNKQNSSSENTGAETTKSREAAGAAPVKTPGTSKRKVPPGLSIVTPSHEEFAQERVIQSAPLNQTFTTGRYQPQPLTRHVANQPSNLSNTSHIHQVGSHSQACSPGRSASTKNSLSTHHHVPPMQNNNRLPPIIDIFGAASLPPRENISQGNPNIHAGASASNTPQSNNTRPPPFLSPGQSTTQPPISSKRPREYRSAEDAQVDLSGGRPELLPKLIHYGGHQPPTPPSPQTTNSTTQGESNRNNNGRRRTRAEYEEGETPPLGNGPSTARKTGSFGENRDSPMTNQMKREQFIRLCAEAWDLFHL